MVRVRFQHAVIRKERSVIEPPTSPIEQVELEPVTANQESTVANLLQLALHDSSEYLDVKIGPNGRFGEKSLPPWWCDPGLHPYLIRADGELAGFVFVWRGSLISNCRDVWDFREFFVLRGKRRQGVGIRAASLAWEQFTGDWEIRVLEQNLDAYQFWSRAIQEFTGRQPSSYIAEVNALRMNVFSIHTPL